MRAKTKKWFSPLFVLTLAIAGIFGVSAAVVDKQAEETPVVEKADAATATNVYYAIDSSTASGKNFKVWIYYDYPNSNEGVFSMSEVGVDNTGRLVFKASFTDKYDGLGWLQFQCFSGSSYQWGDTRLGSSWHGTSEYNNKMCIASGDSWKSFHTVTFNMKSHGTAPATQYVVTNGKATKPSNPTASGYRFDGWYNDSSCTGSTYDFSSTVSSNLTLYAKWTQTYTITYYQNEGYGSAVVYESKGHGEDYTIKTYNDSDIGFHVSALNGFLKYNTAYNGGGTDHYPGEVYKSNAALELFLIQDTATFQYRINSGSWITLENKGNVPSGCQAQFELSSQTFTAGDIVTIRKYRNIDYPENLSFESQENLNNGTILYSYTGSIYVKVTTGGAYQVYVEGYSARGVAIRRGGVDYKIPGTFDESTSGKQKQQYIIDSITVFPNDELKEVYLGQVVGNLTIENTNYGFTNNVASAPGVFKVYLLSYDYGTTFTSVWLDQVSNTYANATAVLLAQFFNDAIEPICESIEGGGPVSDLDDPWDTQAGYFGNISSEAQAELKANTQGSSDIAEFLLRYKRVVSKRGKNNYMELPANQLQQFNRDFNVSTILNGSSTDFSTILIIVASSISILSITALAVLMVKKKKVANK